MISKKIAYTPPIEYLFLDQKRKAKVIDKIKRNTDVDNILIKVELEKINQFHMQGVGLLQGDKAVDSDPC